jgi:adenylate cyclase
MLVQYLRVQCIRHWLACTMGAVLSFSAGLLLLDTTIGNFRIGRRLIDESYDVLFRYRGAESEPQVIVIYMDEPSRQELNQPSAAPWDRRLHAALLDRLTAEKAKVVVFDIIFAEEGNPQEDKAFAEAIERNGRTVLGADLIAQQQLVQLRALSASMAGFQMPYEPFRQVAAGIGLVTLQHDGERAVREHFHGDRDDMPSLSWAAARLVKAPVTEEPGARFQERWIRYYARPGLSFPQSVSYHSVINPNALPKGYFRDKYVFVGAKQTVGFTGSGMDEFKSPYSGRADISRTYYPGVELHATTFTNLIRQDWLRRLPPLWELLMVTAYGLLFGYLITVLRPTLALLMSALAVMAIIVTAVVLLLQTNTWFAWQILVVQIIVGTIWSFGFNSLQLFVQKRLLQQTLALHLSPTRVRQLLTKPEILRPGAEKQLLTIVFTDIENFTEISEHVDSDDLARIMNNYFETVVSECIHPTDGTVLKYIGDAVFAVWNAPLQQPDHQARACRAALQFHKEKFEYSAEGVRYVLKTRIGIHTGWANVGNFGSASRIDYTAIGESVNLASRMENLNKHLGTSILVTEETRRGLSAEFITRRLGKFRLKGFEKAVVAYELLGRDSSPTRTMPLWFTSFEMAREAFERRDFERAADAFQRTIELRGYDGPSRFYLEQIEQMPREDLPPSWSAEMAMAEK